MILLLFAPSVFLHAATRPIIFASAIFNLRQWWEIDFFSNPKLVKFCCLVTATTMLNDCPGFPPIQKIQKHVDHTLDHEGFWFQVDHTLDHI